MDPVHPSVSINEDLTRKLAALARLELTEAEVKTFTSQLGGILGYVGQLAGVDVSGIEPLVHPIELETALRDDLVRPSPVDAQGKPRVLESAPDVLHDGFKVPQVI
jgi:aspartyl-tRNA(Asn)/glutamyl-tRNA(Gln) amidotransferase subunit C